MAGADFHFDPRIRRYHIPLLTQQHRLRHLRSIVARNVIVQSDANTEVGLYFTLHSKPDSEAFYSSEIMKDNLNPVWKDFEPSAFHDIVNPSSPYITIKLWSAAEEIKLLVEWVVFFAGLHFLGKQIPKEGKHFMPNTLIFGMLEGYYGCMDCQECSAAEEEESSFKEAIPADFSALRISYPLNTVGRIKTIERAIKQTQANAGRRRKSIERKLAEAEQFHKVKAQIEFYRIKVSMLHIEVKRQKCNLSNLQRHLALSQDKFARDKYTLEAQSDELKKFKVKLGENWKVFWESRESLLKTEASLAFRRKELITDLSYIYPIAEFPDQKGYSIHNVHLPNSENLSGHDDTMMAVALGYVCHLLLMISQFLNIPLRYEMHFGGSKSSIIDHISVSIPVKNKEFPLYCKGKDRKFFEYGVYLLNKNIAQLRILFGLTTKELSATLPNVYSLIHQRLYITSEANAVSISKIALSRGSSIENSKPIAEKPAQNGFTHVSNSVNNIQEEIVQTRVSCSELEHLKKEMAEMMPHAVAVGEGYVADSSTPGEVFCALSGSLDKGLNDIKVLEKSFVDDTRSIHKPEKMTLQMRRIGHGLHHSSSPNLSSNLQPSDAVSVLQPMDSPQFQNVPLKMWVVGGSHTNSEEEQIDDSTKSSSPSDRTMRNSTFYAHNPDWTGMDGIDSNLIKNDPNFTAIEKAMLAENDFGDDLALRTEQLANRSSSFQMQKVNMSNVDIEQMHS